MTDANADWHQEMEESPHHHHKSLLLSPQVTSILLLWDIPHQCPPKSDSATCPMPPSQKLILWVRAIFSLVTVTG